MKAIKLKPIGCSWKIFRRLEKKGLIRTLTPTARILKHLRRNGLVDTVYSSPVEYGTHKLICVRSDDSVNIRLNFHPHNEEFLIINNTVFKLKPLYLIVGLHNYKQIEKKAHKGTLRTKDFLMLRLRYNDHRTSIFTMLKGTPHCEISAPGKGKPSVFFVSEPRDLPMRYLDLSGYSITVK